MPPEAKTETRLDSREYYLRGRHNLKQAQELRRQLARDLENRDMMADDL